MTLDLHLAYTFPAGAIRLDVDNVRLGYLDMAQRAALVQGVHDLVGVLLELDAPMAVVPDVATVEPPEPQPESVLSLPPAATTAKPPKAKRGGGRPPAASGTCRHALAATLADAGGRWTGSAASLADTWVNRDSAKTEIRKMAAAGLIEQHQPNGRNVTAITLTTEGWKFIGRTPPASIGRPVAAVPDAPATPKIPDLGPMERRPFDPDRVRNAQADAL